MSFFHFFLALSIAFAGWYLRVNQRDPRLLDDIQMITHSENVENLLSKYKDVIGSDFEGYRGHIYRVLSYSMHFLDGKKDFLPVIEASLVYHDIGLWTSKVLTYLEPSSDLARSDLKDVFSEEELQLLHDCIYWHHKITPFLGPHADIVNAVRKADWIDATQGVVHQGMPATCIQRAYEAVPEAGFYKTLQEIGTRYYGSDIVRIIKETFSIFKW